MESIGDPPPPDDSTSDSPTDPDSASPLSDSPADPGPDLVPPAPALNSSQNPLTTGSR